MNKDLFIKLYSNNTTYKEITNKLGITNSMISYYAHKYNLKMRGSGRKNSFKNIFLPLNNECWYWLGYILADGHINQKTNTLSLFSIDRDIMNQFREFIGIDNCHLYTRPSVGNNKPIICINIINGELVKWLVNLLQISEKKAKTINPPIQLNWSLIHGYFDGDGSIRLSGNKKEATIVTGSIKWAYRIKEFLYRYNIYSKVVKDLNAYRVCLYRVKEVEKFYKYLYSENTSKLKYKYNRFVALFGDR